MILQRPELYQTVSFFRIRSKSNTILYYLHYEHGIAKREESVLFFNRFFIRRQHMFPSRKRGYQHNQRRLRQMKIRNQAVQHPELIARINKDLRVLTARRHESVRTGSRFHRTAACRADAEDSVPFPLRPVDFLRLFGENLIMLGMHMVP